MNRLRGAAFVATGLLMGVTGTASSQDITIARPPQGIFGGIRPDVRPTKRLDFGLSLVEAYDDDVPQTVQQTIDPSGLQTGGFSTLLNANASYSWRRQRTEIGANVASSVRHYSELEEVRSMGHSAGLGVSTEMPGAVKLFFNQAASYSPTYFYGLLPTDTNLIVGDAHTTSPDFTVSDLESYLYQTTASLQKTFSPRRNLTVGGDYSYTDRLNESDLWRDIASYGVRGMYSERVGRNTALTGELRYRSGEFGYGGDGTTTEVATSIGVDYSHRLSASRRVSLRGNVGVSATDLPEGTTHVVGFQRQYRTIGETTLIYQFGRSWQMRTDVRRGVEYLADLPEPVFSNGLGAGVDGLLSQRVDFSASAGYSSGASILTQNTLEYDTYAGNAKVRYALNRSLALYVQYLYYYYVFRGNTQLLAGIPSGLERNGARAGLTLWLPVLRK